MDEEKTRVFLSSTFRDFEELRKEILHLLQEIDVDAEAMEFFPASASDSLNTCLQKLETCNVYLGIIGHTYGTIDEQTGKSYTHLEYEFSLKLRDSGIIRDIWIFLPSEKYSPPGMYIEKDHTKLEKLNGFKKTVSDNHTVRFYNNLDDLGKKILIQCNKLMKGKDSSFISRVMMNQYDNYLDSNYSVEIEGMKFQPSEILKEFDLKAYRECFLAWQSTQSEEEPQDMEEDDSH